MRWILVWWIFNPHHVQTVHIEQGFESETSCSFRGAQLRASTNEIVHWHCGLE